MRRRRFGFVVPRVGSPSARARPAARRGGRRGPGTSRRVIFAVVSKRSERTMGIAAMPTDPSEARSVVSERSERTIDVAAPPSVVPTSLSELTTLRLGGPANRLVTASTAEELIDVVRSADTAGEPVLVVGGGSNLLVSDDGWPGVVVLVRTQGIARAGDGVTVQAGVVWDELVLR